MDSVPEKPRTPAHRGNLIGGGILIVVGVLILAHNLFPDFPFGTYWPLILIIIGAAILWRGRRGP